jgi:hypothetical protein
VIQMSQIASDSEDEQTALAKNIEHLDYLMRLVADGVVSKCLALKAKTIWLSARITIGPQFLIPAAAAFTDGPIEYHWAIGPHQLSVEIPADGSCHWSYRNEVSGELWGTETPVDDGFPPQLVERLTRIAASNR